MLFAYIRTRIKIYNTMKHSLLALALLCAVSTASAEDVNTTKVCDDKVEYADSLGVYALQNNKFISVDPIKAQRSRMSTTIFTIKSSNVFPRKTSKAHFNKKAVLRIYTGIPKTQDKYRYRHFTNDMTIDDYMVIKFKSKRDSRRLTVGNAGIFFIGGGSFGAKPAKDLNIKKTCLKDGVYELEITGPAGEYGIAPIYHGSAGHVGVYDFTIDE